MCCWSCHVFSSQLNYFCLTSPNVWRNRSELLMLSIKSFLELFKSGSLLWETEEELLWAYKGWAQVEAGSFWSLSQSKSDLALFAKSLENYSGCSLWWASAFIWIYIWILPARAGRILFKCIWVTCQHCSLDSSFSTICPGPSSSHPLFWTPIYSVKHAEIFFSLFACWFNHSDR